MKDNIYLDLHSSVSKPPLVGLGGHSTKKSLVKEKPTFPTSRTSMNSFILAYLDKDLTLTFFSE